MSLPSPPRDVSTGTSSKAGRACDACRRVKIRCLGKEDPPCSRCRAMGLSCTFDRVGQKSKNETDRVLFLENQMNVIQRTLASIVEWQQSFQASNYTNLPSADRTALASTNTLPSPAHQAAPPRVDMNETRVAPSQEPGGNLSREDDSDDGQSEPDGDPLEEAAMMAPLRNMLDAAEGARLKADGRIGPATTVTHKPAGDRRMRKRPRTAVFDYGEDPEDDIAQRSAETLRRRLQIGTAIPRQRGDLAHAFPDPIVLGFCSDEEGRKLYDIFMKGALLYIPLFDPLIDTWESLRIRSPFSITAILMVAKTIQDAGKPVSDLQRRFKEHAETIGKDTLFSPVARIEAVQAMTLLASWGDTGWRPGGHALMMAMEMGLYDCLPYLARTGMGQGKSGAELEEERPVVVGARVWMVLYKVKLEMAFNFGRPVVLPDEDILVHARMFLEHPLATPLDARIVAACEILALRLPLHNLSLGPKAVLDMPSLDDRVDEINRATDDWDLYWQAYMKNLAVPVDDRLRMLLTMEKWFTVLHSNSRMLHDIRSSRDVPLLPERRQICLRRAFRASQQLVHNSVQNGENSLVFGNSYTHVGLAFAARYLVRLASLLPNEIDRRQTNRDLERLVVLLANLPGFQYASQLRSALLRARRQYVLPPPSAIPSPRRHTLDLHIDLAAQHHQSDSVESTSELVDFGFNDANPDLDFLYNGDLFADIDWSESVPDRSERMPQTQFLLDSIASLPYPHLH